MRREWYAPDERSADEELIAERYRGIRPAFGYPACPDHSEKRKLFDLLGAERRRLELTENFAMTPAASVSGIYFGHPEARYFSVGRDRPRPGRGLRAAQRHRARGGRALARPNLAYEPADAVSV